MTDKKTKRALIEQEKHQTQHDLENHLDSLWEMWALTGDVGMLASFVRDGGKIDDQNTRETIAEFMLSGPPKKPHGSKDVENIAFYIAVESRMNTFKPTKATHKKELSLQEHLASLKKTTKEDAIYETIEQMGLIGKKKGEPFSLSGGITKHKKGKELFVRAFGKEWN